MFFFACGFATAAPPLLNCFRNSRAWLASAVTASNNSWTCTPTNFAASRADESICFTYSEAFAPGKRRDPPCAGRHAFLAHNLELLDFTCVGKMRAAAQFAG